MRILLVHELLGAWGGAEQNIYSTAYALKERGHDLFMVYDRVARKRKAAFTELFQSIFPISFDQGCEQSVEKYDKVIEEVAPDLIYIHKITSIQLLERIVESDVPTVRMVHDHEMYCMRSYRYSPFSRKICSRKLGPYCVFPCLANVKRDRNKKTGFTFVSYRQKRDEVRLTSRLDRILVASEFMKSELQVQGIDLKKIHIFPPVPKIETYDFESSFSEKNIILFVGQIIRGKGVDCLIKSLAQVKNNFKAYIIGSGSHLQYCKSLAGNLGLTDKIEFTGWIDYELLLSHFKEASVFAVPSVWPEPFGAVGLEAFHVGLPVVAFDSGGICDWLTHEKNGLLIDRMDIGAFAGAIDRLLENKELARNLGRKGRQMVNSEYDFEEYIDRIEKLFSMLNDAR